MCAVTRPTQATTLPKLGHLDVVHLIRRSRASSKLAPLYSDDRSMSGRVRQAPIGSQYRLRHSKGSSGVEATGGLAAKPRPLVRVRVGGCGELPQGTCSASACRHTWRAI